MRKADLDHAWKGCRQKEKRRLDVRTITIREPAGLEKQLIVASRVTAFIGINGAGKTGLLNSLSFALTGNPEPRNRPEVVSVDGVSNGVEFTATGINQQSRRSLHAKSIDAAMEVHALLSYVANQPDFSDLLTQYEPRISTKGELALYRYVCKLNYTEIRVFEVEKPATASLQSDEIEAEDDVFPYFEVTIENVKYDTLSMGFGEACACYLIWLISRAQKGSILLLDEPDSHLSSSSRRGLLDALAVMANERELWIAFSTHSSEPLHLMRESEIYFVEAVANHVRVGPVDTKRRIIRALGMYPSWRLLVAVEDVDAKEVVNQIINRWANDLFGIVDVQIVEGGAVQLVRFVDTVSTSFKTCRAIGILDGDQRKNYAEHPLIFFLPGNHDPIKCASEILAGCVTEFAQQLGTDVEHLSRTMQRISYADHHDFCATLLHELGLLNATVPQVRSALIRTWLAFIETAANELAVQVGDYVSHIELSDTAG